MKGTGMLAAIFVTMCAMGAEGQERFETDSIATPGGELAITFLGHGSVMFAFGGKTIQVDPWSQVADYSQFPKADLVLITHEHGDHLDAAALGKVRGPRTKIVTTEMVASKVEGAIVMHNGDSTEVEGFPIEAVAAYNIVAKRPSGEAYHPKGVGNGYVITFGGARVYVAGDTENIPEMKNLSDIAVAFLPMNLPYTMTPEMAAEAARVVRPRILYPYHFSGSDPQQLRALLADETGIEVRIRRME